MQVLAIERERADVSPGQFQPHLKAEARRVWELVQSDALREIYFRQDNPSAILMLECADVAEAKDLLDTLPLVQAGLVAFELIPLAPYPGFARLFTDEPPVSHSR